MLPIQKVILASAARTTSSNSGTLLNASTQLPLLPAEINLILNCTAFSGTALDVNLEHSPDGGTTWVQRCAFAQLTSTGERELRFRNYVGEADAAAEQSVATTSGADANDGMIFRDHRIAWSINGTTATFGVLASIRGVSYTR